ncbi:TerB N-terminal domain-containing protein [Actinopolymorpha sp. B9G3]|uniref:TerB N-terminal domain-containing protein n=1 Tax=Actinopolymorpha sp. B9G3 TaxID=3158970 RepID=UPI0032D8B719
MGNVVRAAAHDHGATSSDLAPLDWAADPFAGQSARDARWLRPGAHTVVGGHAIPGGMIYLGRRLPAARGGRVEPALIDPDLELAPRCPGTDGKDLGYWPSYDRIPPESRAAYLHWLADGRRAPGVPIGYVFLFFYGLERRLLHDIMANPSLRAEVPLLAAEVQGLLEAYGTHASFRRYATEFSHLLELVGAPDETPSDAFAVPELREPRWPPPMTLRRALGAFATEGRRLPATWALAWAWYHPDISLRTPAFRCRDEFARLFTVRYADAHGEGLLVEPGPRRLCVEYQPASAGLRPMRYGRDVPDLYLADEPGRRLAELVGRVTDDLGAYSRWLRRHDHRGDTIAAAALLPAELVVDAEGRALDPEVAAWQGWIERRLTGASSTTVDAGELIARWPTTAAGAMTRREAAALCRLLGHLGIGLEPDVRMGGPAPTAGQAAVVFRTDVDVPPVAGENYAAAVTFAQLAAAVLAADSQLGEDQRRQVSELACAALPLGAGERLRLGAHLHWLATSAQCGLTVLRRRLDGLSGTLRAKIGELLITTATAGGTVLPHHVTSLLTSYRRLGLDPDTVPNRVHASLTTPSAMSSRSAIAPASARAPVPAAAASAPAGLAPPAPVAVPGPVRMPTPLPANEPVTVQAGGAAVGEYLLPRRPSAEPAVPAPDPARVPAPDPPALMPLDTAAIEAKLAETATVSTLLHRIFADDEPAEGDAAGVAENEPDSDAENETGNDAGDLASTHAGRCDNESGGVELVPGLDAPHSALLRALAERPAWPRDAFDALAVGLGLLPAGALDLLNEVALDAADEPLTAGEDVLEIDDDVLQELLGETG